MILMFLKTFWKQIIIVVALIIASYFVYNKIYTIGYNVASVECAERMQEYKDSLNKRIAELEASSTQLVLESIESRKILKRDFSNILTSIKNKPLYTIEQGICKPSIEFVDAYNSAIDRANK